MKENSATPIIMKLTILPKIIIVKKILLVTFFSALLIIINGIIAYASKRKTGKILHWIITPPQFTNLFIYNYNIIN